MKLRLNQKEVKSQANAKQKLSEKLSRQKIKLSLRAAKSITGRTSRARNKTGGQEETLEPLLLD